MDHSTRERGTPVPAMRDEAGWQHFFFGYQFSISEESDSEMVIAEEENEESGNCYGEIIVEPMNEEKSVETDITSQKARLLSEFQIESNNPKNKQTEKVFKNDEMEMHKSDIKITHPSSSLLLQFDQVLTKKLITFFESWIEEPKGKTYLLDGVMWIFALLARLEKPLCQDSCATLHNLYRYSCKIRFDLASDPNFFDKIKSDSSCDERNTLAKLNIVIVICGRYFGQQDQSLIEKAI